MMKPLTIKRALCLFIIYLSFSQVEAQISDFQLRTGVDISGEVTKKTKWRVEYENRFDNNATEIDRILIEPAISYRFQKYMSVAAGYRWSLIFDDLTNNLYQNRLYTDVAFHQTFKSLDFKLRSRIQYDLNNISKNQRFNYKDLYFRHALSMDYNIFGSRLSPSASFELFHNIDYTKLYSIEKFRYTIKIDYRLTRNANLSAYYMIDDEINKKHPKRNYILGCSLGYRFK